MITYRREVKTNVKSSSKKQKLKFDWGAVRYNVSMKNGWTTAYQPAAGTVGAEDGQPGLMTLLQAALREAGRAGDPLLTRMAASGELLVGGIRLALVLVILLMHVTPVFERDLVSAALGVNIALIAWALLMLYLIRRHYAAWMSWMSSLVDVSIVTGGLWMLVLLGRPDAAVNSRILFEAYFLAVGFCALRYDWRLALLTGLTAAAQYLSLVIFADTRWDINAMASPAYGGFTWGMQYGRLVVLMAVTLLVCFVIVRSTYLRRQSLTDVLTGLHNRGYFEERAREEMDRARRYVRPLAVAVLDIDHFKQINDTHGHAQGDQALKVIAQELQHCIRSTDLLARVGGEEFVLLFPETHREEIHFRLEAIRERISRTKFPVGNTTTQLTASLGVACYPEDGKDIRGLLDLADERMFQAKREGRNRVISGTRIRESAGISGSSSDGSASNGAA